MIDADCDTIRRADLDLLLPEEPGTIAIVGPPDDPLAVAAANLGHSVIDFATLDSLKRATVGPCTLSGIVRLGSDTVRGLSSGTMIRLARHLKPRGVMIVGFDRRLSGQDAVRHRLALGPAGGRSILRGFGAGNLLVSHHFAVAPSVARPRLVVEATRSPTWRTLAGEALRIGAEELSGPRAAAIETTAFALPLLPPSIMWGSPGHILVGQRNCVYPTRSALDAFSDGDPCVLQVGWGGLEGDRTVHHWTGIKWGHISIARTPNWNARDLMEVVDLAGSAPGWRVPSHALGPTVGRYSSVVIEHLQGASPTQRDVSHIAASLGVLHRHGERGMAPFSTLSFGKLGTGSEILQRAHARFPQLVAVMGEQVNAPVTCGLTHGDASLRNLRIGDGWVGAFDWDTGSLTGLPALDPMTLIARTKGHGRSVIAAYEDARGQAISRTEVMLALCVLGLKLSPTAWSSLERRSRPLLERAPEKPHRGVFHR